MKEKIEKILEEVKSFHADSKEALEQFRIQYLSKKGTITELFTEFKQVAPEMRKELGMCLNDLKNTIQDIIEEQQKQFETKSEGKTDLDLSLPVDAMNGSRHPLSIVRNEINDIFKRLGFVVAEGPEVEDDFHSRYNATKKIYEYRILLTNKDPLSYDLAYIYPMELDVELFKKALQKFEGTHNYQDFTSKEEDEGGFVRTIYNIEVIKEGDLLRVIFTGNGFMRYQIRNMIGAAINVANKKEPLEFIDEHLKDNKNREIIAYKAPASGLYLVDVIYRD